MFVRVVTEQDVKKWLRSDLSPKEADVFLGLSYIKSGFDGHDEYTLMRGYEKLRPLVKGLVPPEEWEIELPTKNGSKISIRSGGGQKWNATHYNYSRLLTQMLKNTRFVMWCSLKKYHRFPPALFCRQKDGGVCNAVGRTSQGVPKLRYTLCSGSGKHQLSHAEMSGGVPSEEVSLAGKAARR